MCLCVTLLIGDLWQFCVCCIRSDVTRCTRLMMRYLYRMCQCRSHAMPWSHISILMRRLVAKPRSIAGFLSHLSVPLERSCWPCIRWCGTAGFKSMQDQCFFIDLSSSIPTMVFYHFPFYLLSVHRLVLRGWGLRTDRVYITLSQPCTANLFLL